MSYYPDSIRADEQFSASQSSTGRSSQNPQVGWDSSRTELKHQTGRSVVPDNSVDILPKGTHLPPDRTFLPQNIERNVNSSTCEDGVGVGLDNEQIQDTIPGATSKDVYSGMGLPGDQSQAEARALGDGGGKKSGGGLAKYGKGEMLAEDKQKRYDPAMDYVGKFEGGK